MKTSTITPIPTARTAGVLFRRLLTVTAMLLPSTAQAHDRFELDATVGARWGAAGKAEQQVGGVAAAEGKIYADPAVSYGGLFGYRAERNGFVYLSFSRQVAPVHLDGDSQDNLVTGKLAIEYYQLGGNVELTRGRWVPYFGASVGLSRWVSMGGGGDRLFFTAGLDGGVKFEILEHLHLRFLARLPVTMASGELYCVDPANCVELTKFTPLVQGEAQIGLGVSF